MARITTGQILAFAVGWWVQLSVEPVLLVVVVVVGGLSTRQLYRSSPRRSNTWTGRADDSYIKDIRPEISVRETKRR